MKYLLLLVLILVGWTVIHGFFLETRGAGDLATFGDKLRDLGRHFHSSIGMLAVILVILLVIRLIYHLLFAS
jgi:hypothetical protein